MNEFPEHPEIARNWALKAIEDELNKITDRRLQDETYAFWATATLFCTQEQLKELYYNTRKYVNNFGYL